MGLFDVAEPPQTGPHEADCQHGCHRGKPEQNWWLLTVEEGQARVACGICGCSFEGLADGNEGLEMGPVAVRLEYRTNCTGHYFGPLNCDCGWWFQATPKHG